MTKHPAARFVQHKVAQGLVLCDVRSHVPQGLARWWYNTTDDDVANLTLSMAGDNVNGFGAFQLRVLSA